MSSMDEKKRCPDFAEILRTTPPDSQLRQQIASCFYEELKRLARMRCRNRDNAEDAAHDGLITALERLDSFRGEAPIGAWLRRIVATACSRLQRGRKNDPAYNVNIDDAPRRQIDGEVDPAQESALLIHERLEIMKEALWGVDETNRSLLLLHEGQDASIESLAEQFGLSEEGVKSRLKRTRAHLRQVLLSKAEELVE